jgi:c-di-GMP-binding flagellar brake protein YcgR
VILLLDVRSQITARILDISPSGCRMRCDEKFPVGIYRRVEIEFVLDGLPFRLPGVVQSLHDRFTTGIRFLDVSERRKEQLMQVIDEITEIKREAAAAQALSASGKPADMLPNA